MGAFSLPSNSSAFALSDDGTRSFALDQPGRNMANATKATLEARIAELEAQLAASSSTTDPREAGMVRLVGMLKAVKDISRNGGKFTVCAILTNSTTDNRGGQETRIDLPIDSIIATDNGVDIATQIWDIAQQTEWARVAISGYWTVFGEVTRNDRGYPVAHRRQLRAQRIEVLNAKPFGEERAITPEVVQPYAEPTAEEIPF